MIGLVKKDFLVMRKTIITYLVMLLVFAAAGIYEISFACSFFNVMILMLPISAFAYDEQAKWDSYASALPLGRSRIVAARYLFLLILILGVSALGAAVIAVHSIISRTPAVDSLAAMLGALAASILISDIMLPLNYKFGAERARPFLFAIVFIPFIALAIAWKLGLLDDFDLSWLDSLPNLYALATVALLPLAALAGTVISCLVSCFIMSKKEF